MKWIFSILTRTKLVQMTLKEKTAYIHSNLPNVNLRKSHRKRLYQAGIWRKMAHVDLKPSELSEVWSEMFGKDSQMVEKRATCYARSE